MILLTKLALQSRTVTVMILILVLAGGIYAYRQLQQELYPEITLRLINVSTSYQQGTPYQVSQDVTKPIEDVIIGMEGLKELTSTSRSSNSRVQASFENTVDIEEAEAEIVSRVSGLRLPDAAGDPRVFELTPNLRPVMELSVSGQRDIPDLLRIVERQIVPPFKAVPGVLDVEVEGGVNEQVFVTVDPALLDTYGLTIQNVIGALQSNSVDVNAGSVDAGDGTVTVRAFHGYTDLDAIRNLPVGYSRSAGTPGSPRPGGGVATPISMSEIADVRVATPEARTISRTNGQPSVSLNVHKTGEGNTIDITHTIDELMAELHGQLPPDLEISVIDSQAPRLEEQLGKVLGQGIQGFFFAVVAVFLFLLQLRPRPLAGIANSIRPTVIIALSIPLSVMVTMLVMALFDWTMNFMSLAGLAIAVGRIVDDSIVVLENIYRHMQDGSPRSVAVIAATQEVSPPVVASTLTTVAVFIPLAFLPGVVGQFFSPFAQTVCVSLLASTLVALTAVPVLASWFLRAGDMVDDPENPRGDTYLQKIYTPILRLALRYRLITAIVSILVVLASLTLIRTLPIELFSQGRTEGIRIDLTLSGNPSTVQLVREVGAVERILDEFASQGAVERYQVTLGAGSRNFGSSADAAFNRAGFNILLGDAAPDDLDEQIRNALPEKRGVTTRVFADTGGPGGGGRLQLTLTGTNYEDVRIAADRLQTAVERDPGVRNVQTNIEDGREELTIAIDPNEAGRYGLSSMNVASQIRTWMRGSEVGEINLSGETLDVVVRGAPEAVDDPMDLPTLPITGNAGAIPLGSIADARHTVGPSVVTHYDGHRSATISGRLVGRDAGAIGDRIDAVVASTPLPPGVSIRSGGTRSDIRDEFNNVYVAMVIGVSLVYLVMVATLGSLKIPFIVVLSMPLAVVGALVALVLTDRSLSLPALMGFLLLVGIVVTNAIVLLTFVHQQRRAGLAPLDAVMAAGRTRVRPILMTAFTTILALIPLSLSESAGLVGAELATVVIGGLISSTFLTLVAVPVVYMLFEESVPNLYRRVLRMLGIRTATPAVDNPEEPSPATGETPAISPGND
ncbi:MAG: efflux RND transporter permease subunit [Chloroflexota bacterium]|nr:efflux RND transporter permease subunit [Chloroflexota bacterium]MDE2959555.1 efflux RND transporter permease subunit [Chloroflexota bacterium]